MPFGTMYKPCPDCGLLLYPGRGAYGLAWHVCGSNDWPKKGPVRKAGASVLKQILELTRRDKPDSLSKIAELVHAALAREG